MFTVDCPNVCVNDCTQHQLCGFRFEMISYLGYCSTAIAKIQNSVHSLSLVDGSSVSPAPAHWLFSLFYFHWKSTATINAARLFSWFFFLRCFFDDARTSFGPRQHKVFWIVTFTLQNELCTLCHGFVSSVLHTQHKAHRHALAHECRDVLLRCVLHERQEFWIRFVVGCMHAYAVICVPCVPCVKFYIWCQKSIEVDV